MGSPRAVLLASGLASFVLLGLAQAIFGPALPAWQRDFGLDTAQAGWILSAFWVGCLLGVIGHFLAHGRPGPRWGLASTTLGAGLMAVAPVWPLVLLGGVAFGAGYGSLAAVFNPRILSAFGARGPAMLGLLNAIFSLGAIAAPLVFLALGARPGPTFLIFAALGGLIWLASGRIGATAQVEDARQGFRPDWPIMAFGALAIGMEASLVNLGPTALIRAGVAEAEASWMLSLFYVAYLLARTALVFVADRVPSFALYTGAMAFTLICAVGAVTLSPSLFFPAMGASASLFFHGYFVTALGRMGSDARVPSLVIGGGLVGAIILPLICAQAMAQMGDRGFFWLLILWAGSVTLAALAVRGRMSQPRAI